MNEVCLIGMGILTDDWWTREYVAVAKVAFVGQKGEHTVAAVAYIASAVSIRDVPKTCP